MLRIAQITEFRFGPNTLHKIVLEQDQTAEVAVTIACGQGTVQFVVNEEELSVALRAIQRQLISPQRPSNPNT
jgi:hypothetical protein